MTSPDSADKTRRPLLACVVVVTPRSFATSLREVLETKVAEVRYRPGPLSAGELAEVVEDADGLIAGLDDLNAEVFARASRLKVVARYGVGLDRVDLAAADARRSDGDGDAGRQLQCCGGAHDGFHVRDCPLGRHRPGSHREGAWPSMRGVELHGRTLGLIGAGRVGSLVAAKATSLGMQVLAYDPYVTSSPATLVDLGTLKARSDFVSLHVPLTEQTRGLVDRQFLSDLKSGAFLINTARGELIDESTLIWALDIGRLAGAALDVVADEPPPLDHVFRRRR